VGPRPGEEERKQMYENYIKKGRNKEKKDKTLENCNIKKKIKDKQR
jgi:hypothetical protein